MGLQCKKPVNECLVRNKECRSMPLCALLFLDIKLPIACLNNPI